MTTALTWATTKADVLLKDRLLVLGTADSVRSLIADINQQHGGVVVIGAGAREAVHGLRQAHPDLVLLEQPQAHKSMTATTDCPFPLGSSNDDESMMPLFDLPERTLTEVLDAQRENGANVAILPTGFIEAGAHTVLTVAVTDANKLDRSDLVMHLPLASTWLSVEKDRKKLIAAIRRLRHPAVISIADRSDPAAVTGVIEGLTLVFEAVGNNCGVWFSDIGTLEALAQGGLCGAVGVTSTLRHIVEPGMFARSPSKGRDRTPNVLIPQLLRFKRPRAMQTDWFANGGDPGCPCAICEGREISRFGTSAGDIAEAHRHNLLWFTTKQLDLLASGDRRAWWAHHLAEASAAHMALASSTGVRAIAPDTALARRIKLNPPPIYISH